MVASDSLKVVIVNYDIRVSSEAGVESGATLLPAKTTFTVSVNIARPQFATHQALNNVAFHQEQNCELHVPVYDLKPSFESQYLAQDQKRIIYNEVLLTI